MTDFPCQLDSRYRLFRACASLAAVVLSSGWAQAGRVELSPGMRVAVRIDENLTTHTRYHFFSPILNETLDQDILGPNGRVLIPAGSIVKLAMAESRRAGRVTGRSRLRLRLYSVVLPDGSETPLDGYPTALESGSKPGKEGTFHGKRGLVKDAGFDLAAITTGVGVGMAVGGPIGLAAGAGGGLLAAGLWTVGRRGPDLTIPAGSVIEFTLGRAAGIPVAADPPADPPARSYGASSAIGSNWGQGLAIPPSSDLVALMDSLNDPKYVLAALDRVSFKERPESDRVFATYLSGVCHLKLAEPKKAREELNSAFTGAKRLNLPASAQTEIAWNLVLALKATDSQHWEQAPQLQDPVVQAALVQTTGGGQ